MEIKFRKEAEKNKQGLRARMELFEDDLQDSMRKLQEEQVRLVETSRTRPYLVRDGDIQDLCKFNQDADILRGPLGELTNQGVQSIAEKKVLSEMQGKIEQGQSKSNANTIQVIFGMLFYSERNPTEIFT
ncbi:unnamed protein product [Phytophthora fragariaefolia]|uniref:Unnamed protein product n=1 Tax=Phytophthora fragariaefolia TaxID=1490495 RepID=A0A9W7DCZ8_9STRA|nr:unnamed protein product [Phytophthora fragariaefolia]